MKLKIADSVLQTSKSGDAELADILLNAGTCKQTGFAAIKNNFQFRVYLKVLTSFILNN